MHPVGPVCLRLAEESKLTDCRILVQSQRVIASTSIPSRPAPSFASSAMQTVVQTYANASVEAVNVRCMPWGEFCQLVWEMVQENAMSRVLAATGTELLLNMELVQVQRVAATFVPIAVEGNLTPESDEGRHLIELSEEEVEEGNDGEETFL